MNMSVLREPRYRTDANLPSVGITRLILTEPIVTAIKDHARTYWAKHTVNGDDVLIRHLRDVIDSLSDDDILELMFVRRENSTQCLAQTFMDKMTSMGELKKQIDAACFPVLDARRHLTDGEGAQ